MIGKPKNGDKDSVGMERQRNEPKQGQPLTAESVGLLKGDLVRQLDWDAITVVDDVSDQGQHVGVSLDGKYGVWPRSRFTFIGRPGPDGFIPWSGGENPVPGQMVDVRKRNGSVLPAIPSNDTRWKHREATAFSDIIAFRLSPTPLPIEDAERAGDGAHVGQIVPAGCTGTSLSFEPGVLHVSKDGSGYIAIDEERFTLEDDRCEGPDGPEGSVHWITRMDVGEMLALRDFLNGPALPTPTDNADGLSVDRERKLAEIISDSEIVRVHGSANFGTMTPREVVNDGMRKVAVGYHTGHTQFSILREHGLITKPKGLSYDVNLTKKGKKYVRVLLHDVLFGSAALKDRA